MALARAARRSMTVVAALAAVMVTSGCLSGGADEPPESSRGLAGGHALSGAGAEEVLPNESSLPPEIRVVDESGDNAPDTEATTYPATCLDARLAGREAQALEEHEQVRRARTYAGRSGGSFTVRVVSHDIPVPRELFDDAGAAHARCGEFQVIDHGGTTRWELVPAAFALLGERTYAMRLTALAGDEDFVGGRVQVAAISIGHNLIHLVYAAGTRSDFDPALLEELAEIAVANLQSS